VLAATPSFLEPASVVKALQRPLQGGALRIVAADEGRSGGSLPDLIKPGRRSSSSAGILMYRRTGPSLEVLLVHPGGPYWRKKDEGAWSIPKGEIDDGEEAEIAARREFMEETGVALSETLEPLGEIRQRGGKRVIAFAVESDLDVQAVRTNTFEIEWPPKGGRMQSFPEIDRAEWFDLPFAHAKIIESQRPLLDQLVELVAKLE
jgi:predicted NUDIX family NTP pyrophosphohydrolase